MLHWELKSLSLLVTSGRPLLPLDLCSIAEHLKEAEDSLWGITVGVRIVLDSS